LITYTNSIVYQYCLFFYSRYSGNVTGRCTALMDAPAMPVKLTSQQYAVGWWWACEPQRLA